ncbi:RHS repeat-associated core domain-containing protein [Pseudomonas fluorescens]|uniref:RHS repeat-associated core domain-containing protein n=1 Tax=Pseudomonas fluorescens TaxID=294 RepID=A0A5E7FYV6_PSEFL|nr:RHS repeat-associated core domain-containing protein [Pseudomonas fluorescens]VVO43652.1 hypothetical protein PS710_06248 [Pseudomonas fluorescens]
MPHSPADNHARSQQSRTVLLATDNKNSILAEVAGDEPNPIAYSAYGQQSAQQDVATHLGFNGVLRETRFGWYLLGNGYRAYNPTLMRFHSPDSWSPFGGGGLNAYMYCVGDPVNFSDPTGHMKAGKVFSGLFDFFFGGAERTGRKGIAYVPAGMGEMRPEPERGLSGLLDSALVVGGAPGPRHGVPRQSSYNYGLPSPDGYNSARASDPFGQRRRSTPDNPNLQAGPYEPSNQREGVRRDSKGEIVVTRRNSSGQMVTELREPVRGGGDSTGTNPRTRMNDIQTRDRAFVEERNEARRLALIGAMEQRNAQLRLAGLPQREIIIAIRREGPGMLRRINEQLR